MSDIDRVPGQKEQLDLLDSTATLETLPSAKMTPTDKVGVHRWTNFYAAFSEAY